MFVFIFTDFFDDEFVFFYESEYVNRNLEDYFDEVDGLLENENDLENGDDFSFNLNNLS